MDRLSGGDLGIEIDQLEVSGRKVGWSGMHGGPNFAGDVALLGPPAATTTLLGFGFGLGFGWGLVVSITIDIQRETGETCINYSELISSPWKLVSVRCFYTVQYL